MNKSERDNLLDGWRGIAVLAVLFGHAVHFRFGRLFPQKTVREVLEQSAASPFELVGYVINRLAWAASTSGVYVFFAISGYIISLLLIREQQRHGAISIKAFYIRRAFRILPAFICYVTTCCVLRQMGEIQFATSELFAVFTFTANLDFWNVGWFFTHIWSLSVEEQFYIVWPISVSLLPERMRSPILITLSVLFGALTIAGIPVKHAVSFHCIALGALYACNATFRELIGRASGWSGFIIASLFITMQPNLMSLALLYRAMQAVLPLVIVYLVFSSRDVNGLKSIIESNPFRSIGLISYSLYLWQQLFLAFPDSYLMWVPSLWLLPVVAVLSYWVVEVPCIRMGRSLASAVQTAHCPAEKSALEIEPSIAG